MLVIPNPVPRGRNFIKCSLTVNPFVTHTQNIVTDDGNLSKEIFKELIKALLLLKDTNPEGLGKFLGSIVTIFQNYSQNVDDNTVAVDPEVRSLLLYWYSSSYSTIYMYYNITVKIIWPELVLLCRYLS